MTSVVKQPTYSDLKIPGVCHAHFSDLAFRIRSAISVRSIGHSRFDGHHSKKNSSFLGRGLPSPHPLCKLPTVNGLSHFDRVHRWPTFSTRRSACSFRSFLMHFSPAQSTPFRIAKSELHSGRRYSATTIQGRRRQTRK
jgi:hypothetical protein